MLWDRQSCLISAGNIYMLLCYAATVKRTTIFLPEELHEQLRLDAFRAKVSMAELIRARLRDSLPRPPKHGPRHDPILRVAGICRGPVFSNDIDEALYGE